MDTKYISTNISLRELEEAYQIAARIVANFGDAYLPTFERLHHEMQIKDKQQSLKSIAWTIATNLKY